jgi:hypothetical protein
MEKDELRKYLEEELSDKEKNALERKMSDDPFFADSVDGLQQWKSDTGKNINDLEDELNKKIDKKSADKNFIQRLLNLFKPSEKQ